MTWILLTSAILLLGALLVGALLKRAILGSVPLGIAYVPVEPADYPALDANALERYTWHYSALGFVHVGDYCLEAERGTVQPGFARLFVHPSEACYVEVNQLFPPTQSATPMRSMIGTLFEDDWALATTDRVPDGAIYMMRQPKSLWACRPDLSPSQLYRLHTELRDRVARDLGVRPVDATSRDAYVAHEQAAAYERLDTIRRKNIFVALAEIFLFPVRPKYEWLGDYRPSEPGLADLPGFARS
jgi:hypothetical protein